VLVAANLKLNLSQFETYKSGGFVACSGATSQELLNGHDGEPSQLKALSSATRWVTVTAGGDDLHFSNVLVACLDLNASVKVVRAMKSYTQSDVVHENTTCDQYLASANSLFDVTSGSSKEEATLEHVYEQVFVHAPNAELAVLNYPQLFTESPPKFCPVARGINLASSAQLNVGYSAGQITAFNRVERELNIAVASAVSVVSGLGDDIHLVDVNSLTKAVAIPCNVAANGRSDINALRFSVGSPLATIVKSCHFDLAHLLRLHPFVSCPSNEGSEFLQHLVAGESFHPKQSAHETLARAVEALFGQPSTTTTTLNPTMRITSISVTSVSNPSDTPEVIEDAISGAGFQPGLTCALAGVNGASGLSVGSATTTNAITVAINLDITSSSSLSPGEFNLTCTNPSVATGGNGESATRTDAIQLAS
jgi:hypothetical protein